VQSQQSLTESQVFEYEALPRTESADHPAEEMSERRDHGKSLTGKVPIELCAEYPHQFRPNGENPRSLEIAALNRVFLVRVLPGHSGDEKPPGKYGSIG
jgi:hypothetical protein